eukprot:jgi/Bigna1/146923/aug1.124_g21631
MWTAGNTATLSESRRSYKTRCFRKKIKLRTTNLLLNKGCTRRPTVSADCEDIFGRNLISSIGETSRILSGYLGIDLGKYQGLLDMAEEKDEDASSNPLQPLIDYAQGSGFGTGLVGMVSLYVRDVWFPRKPAGAHEAGSRRYR